MALSKNMVQNKDFILTLDLFEKLVKTTLAAHLIFASCAKNFGDRNSLKLCLFTKSTGRDKLVSNFCNDSSTSSTLKEELEVAEVKIFAKKT